MQNRDKIGCRVDKQSKGISLQSAHRVDTSFGNVTSTVELAGAGRGGAGQAGVLWRGWGWIEGEGGSKRPQLTMSFLIGFKLTERGSIVTEQAGGTES